MDELREIIKSLLGLRKLPEGEGFEGFTDEQLAEASAKAEEVFAKAVTDKDSATAASSHAVVTNVAKELEDRAADAARIEEELAKLAAEIEAVKPKVEADPEPEEEEEEKEEEPEVVVEAPATPAPEAPAAPEVVVPEPVAVAATATPAPTPAPAPKPKAVPAPSAPPKPEATFSIQAGADIPDYSAGTSMTPQELGEAFSGKARAFRGGRVGDRATVAKIRLKYPSEYVIDSGSLPVEETQRRIDEVVAALRADTAKRLQQIVAAGKDYAQVEEITAAGGFCAPFTPRYDICQQGDDVRPLRDSLPTFNATRGGITYLTPPQLSDVDGAVNVYTEEQDTTGYDYPKGCIRVDCGDPVTEQVQAITLCMEVGNFQRLSFPENFRAWWHYGNVAFARAAEVELWDKMVALAENTAEMGGGARTANTLVAGSGAVRNTLIELERYVQQLRYKTRSTDPLHLWAPEWMKAQLRADLTLQMPGDNTIGVTDAQLIQYLAARGVATTFLLDGQDPGDEDDALPDTFKAVLALEGTFLRLDMGVLDFGTEIRDWTQIRQNDSGAFFEIFEGLAATCRHAQSIVFPVCPTGRTAANNLAITC